MVEKLCKNPDENFNNACIMAEKKFSHDEIIGMLKEGNISEKQIAALCFDNPESEKDAAVLISNLTGCDGKIREAVAFTVNRLIKSDARAAAIFSKLNPEIFAKASIDINANICKFVIDSVKYLSENTEFAQLYSAYLLRYIDESLNQLDSFIYKDKKYTINKQLFKLYWSLEGIKHVADFIPDSKLYGILSKCIKIEEYTIREKVAEIIININKFSDLKNQLETDNNCYVRLALNHHRSFKNF